MSDPFEIKVLKSGVAGSVSWRVEGSEAYPDRFIVRASIHRMAEDLVNGSVDEAESKAKALAEEIRSSLL